MRATELFKADGSSTAIYYCAGCRVVHRTLAEADQCCQPRMCECGLREIEKHMTVCAVCRARNEEFRENARYDRAEKIPAEAWGGPVWCDISTNEGYFRNIDELLEHLEGEAEDEGDGELPLHIYTCSSHRIVDLDYDQIIENATQDAHDEWDSGVLVGEEELKAALAKFNEDNKEQVSWQPDYKVAVIVGPEYMEGFKRDGTSSE